MRRFNSIKKSRKKSKDIDEKIEYLNRELVKTGLQEMMTTSKIYQGSTNQPNQEYINLQGLSLNGYPIGLSAADGNHIGGAGLGIDPSTGVSGVALSPPDPITGLRRTARHITNGTGNSIPLRPGKTTTRGDGNNPPTITMGSAVWFYHPETGTWNNAEYFTSPGQDVGAMGFWDTNNAGFFFHNTTGSHSRGDILSVLSGINFGPNGVVGPPQTTVLTQNRLDDPGFLPINVPDLSKQAFDYLKVNARDLLDKAAKKLYIRSPGQMPWSYLDEWARDYWRKQALKDLDLLDKDDFKNQSYEVLANIFSNPESTEAQEAALNIVSNEIKEKPELASIIGKTWKAGETFLRFITGTLPDVLDNDYLGKKYVNSMIASAEPFYGDDVYGDGAGDKLVFGDNLLGTTQPPKREGNTITVDYTYDFKTNAEELKGKKDQLSFMQRTFGEILGNAFGKYSLDASPKAFGTIFPGLGDLADNAIGGFFSKIIEGGDLLGGSQGKPGKLTMDLSQIASENPKLLSHLFNKGLISYDELKALRAGEDLPESYKKQVKESYITEGVGLGHFEPEVLNVDINDIRKGIMPEFPKDPPPEMINGYSAKSKLAPKTIEGEPFIKITKKDLAKNHKLTDKEISEFMSDIKIINYYIKKNPAELKYAMIRYPKDDPRLAQLNYKMDQMKAASDEYMETHFPENQKLFNRLQQKISNTIGQTDPKNFKDHTPPPQFTDDLDNIKRRKETVSRHFKKRKRKG